MFLLRISRCYILTPGLLYLVLTTWIQMSSVETCLFYTALSFQKSSKTSNSCVIRRKIAVPVTIPPVPCLSFPSHKSNASLRHKYTFRKYEYRLDTSTAWTRLEDHSQQCLRLQLTKTIWRHLRTLSFLRPLISQSLYFPVSFTNSLITPSFTPWFW